MDKLELRSKLVIAALAVVLIAAATGYAWSVRQKALEQRALQAAVAASTEQMRASLLGKQFTAAAPAGLRHRDYKIVQAAELYTETARAIAQRSADRAKYAEQTDQTVRALAFHMRAPRGRNDLWIRDALELKKRVERSYYDYDSSLKALDQLLEQLPDSRKRLSERVEPALLLEEGLRQQALKQVRADAARAALELAQVRTLPAR